MRAASIEIRFENRMVEIPRDDVEISQYDVESYIPRDCQGSTRGARRRIIDVRAFVRALYIGRDGLLPMQFVNPDA